ncbi:MAG: 30S ribosomal protein S17 [Alphaproteobacteria bacterium]|nr:30S ribosomal protein S17 [Alphaproteobacteria bacterium]
MPRRVMEGKVVSDAMDKTVTVLVERRTMHPIYKKYVKKSAKYAAHDENNAFRTGDFVTIEECRPISKRKCWTVTTDPTSLKREAQADGNSAETAAKSPAKAALAAKSKAGAKKSKASEK